MKRSSLGAGALVGGLLTAPIIGIMYLANELLGLPFAPFDLFDWIARVLPGPLITTGIDLMIDTMRLAGLSVAATAKAAEQIVAVLLFLAVGVAAGASFFAATGLRGPRPHPSAGLVAGALVGLPMMAVSIAIGGSTVHPVFVVAWLSALSLVWGTGLRMAYVRLIPAEAPAAPSEAQAGAVEGIDRRQFLVRVGAATATITVASSGLGYLLAEAARRELDAERAAYLADQARLAAASPQPTPQPPTPSAGEVVVVPAPGTRPEYTAVADHYKVFLRTSPTVIDGATWSLPIVGLVDNPVSLTLDDLRNNYDARDQIVTLSCISGRIGTTLISTTRWTGVSLQDILADLGLQPDARYLQIRGGDGFYETVDLDLIASDERIMLSYAWDGAPIPIDHGFPLRIWIPDRYGMKQPKWITGIDVLSEYKQGYWVERGWDEVARVRATSVIDTVADEAVYESEGRQMVPVGGIAFAGARGISKVEVRVDGGPWQEARLRSPLSETTWVLWRYDWAFTPGDHEFEVRCAEGDGTPQIEAEEGNRPSGATGIHSREADL